MNAVKTFKTSKNVSKNIENVRKHNVFKSVKTWQYVSKRVKKQSRVKTCQKSVKKVSKTCQKRVKTCQYVSKRVKKYRNR